MTKPPKKPAAKLEAKRERDNSECIGLRAALDAAERRQEELESALAMAERKVEVGKELFKALYKRLWIDGDDHDMQLSAMCDWALIPEEERE